MLHQVVEIVNYVKSRPIKSTLFEELCKSMDSQHVRLLMHTDVRWLSKGKVFTRVHELQKELIVYFIKKSTNDSVNIFDVNFGWPKWNI